MAPESEKRPDSDDADEAAAVDSGSGETYEDDNFGGWADDDEDADEDDGYASRATPDDDEDDEPEADSRADDSHAEAESPSATEERSKRRGTGVAKELTESRGPSRARTSGEQRVPDLRTSGERPAVRVSGERRAGVPPRRGPSEQRRKSGGSNVNLGPVMQQVQTMGSRMQHLEANMQKVARAMMEVVKEGQNRKKAYDVLYEELRQYKEDFLWQCQKPLFLELLGLFDSILRVERRYEVKDEMEEVAEDFRYLKEELQEILYRHDIELIEDHPDYLDIGFQKPIKRIDTEDPADDKAVVQYLREGFRRDDSVLRPQEIVVKRYVDNSGKE